jgi:hypothetical protein
MKRLLLQGAMWGLLGVVTALPAFSQVKTDPRNKNHKSDLSHRLLIHQRSTQATSMKAHNEMTNGSTVHSGLLHGRMVHGKLRRGRLHATLAHGRRLHTMEAP